MKRVSLFLAFLFLFSLSCGCVQAPLPDTPTVAAEAGPLPDPVPPAEPPEPSPSAPPSDATPLLWLVTAPDGQTMFLFGSIHAADETVYPLPAVIADAFYSCEALAVEVDIVAFESDYFAQLAVTNSMLYSDGAKITDEIGEELYERATAVLAELWPELDMGFPLFMMDSFKPYMWSDVFSLAASNRAGLAFDLGLDRFFLHEAKELGMEILEVESAGEQIDMLLGFSLPLRNLLLEESLDVDAATEGLLVLYDLWKQGDERILEELLFSEETDMPDELAEEYWMAMNVRRNILMAEAAERYMAEGKNVFFVVGLLHMLGEDGIVNLLRRNGYTVERVPHSYSKST